MGVEHRGSCYRCRRTGLLKSPDLEICIDCGDSYKPLPQPTKGELIGPPEFETPFGCRVFLVILAALVLFSLGFGLGARLG